MSTLRYVSNFLLGGINSYAYSLLLGYVVLYTPIRTSTFSFAECLTAAELTAYCRFLNYVELLTYDVAHYFLTAIALVAGLGMIHKWLSRNGLFYDFRSFSVGFVAVWAVTMVLALDNLIPSSWYIAAVWLSELLVFLVAYHLAVKYLFKAGPSGR